MLIFNVEKSSPLQLVFGVQRAGEYHIYMYIFEIRGISISSISFVKLVLRGLWAVSKFDAYLLLI